MTTEEKLRWQREICGVDKYHEQNCTGKGVVVLCHENTEHGRRAMDVLRQVAPDVSIIYASVTEKSIGGKLTTFSWKIDGTTYTFDEVMSTFKPDIISCSLRDLTNSTGRDNIVKPYIDNGELILVTAAGNEGVSSGVQAKYGCGIVVGACQFHNGNKKDIRLASYSGRTKNEFDVDYVGFMGDWEGTSAATPFVAGQIALFISKFGKVSQDEFQRLIKPYCKDLGDEGMDWEYGNGLIVLPIDIDTTRDEKMYKDVENNRWSAEDIQWASDMGFVKGFEDETFRPVEPITREQICVVLRRFYEKIKE